MQLRITIDIFSGRRNLSAELKGDEAARAMQMLRPGRTLAREEKAPEVESNLGYRGLVIETRGGLGTGLPRVFRLIDGELFGPGLHRAAQGDFEEYFLGRQGPIQRLEVKGFSNFVRKELDRFRKMKSEYRRRRLHWPRGERCRCAPLYEPLWWNDNGQKQFNNNCYNYSTNYRTDTFAQPGRAAGAMYTALSCTSVRPAAEKDSLVSTPNARNKCPEEGHLVALVIAPGWDFHWYRKGRNGYWTHKPGGTPATNLDNSGVTIPDPRTANRGPYTDFCTFMVVKDGHIKIR